MKKVLVPVDGSGNALRAVAYAVEAVREQPSVELELLHVLDPVTLRSHAVMTQEEIHKLYASEADPVLQPARQVIERAGIPCVAAYRVGSAANEIAAHVDEKGFDTVIMGTRGMGPVANAMIGSVATRVVHLVKVPVILIK